MQIPRNFKDRPADEQKWILKTTWCDICQAENLGMLDPVEYTEDGEIFVEGKCARCGNVVVSEVAE